MRAGPSPFGCSGLDDSSEKFLRVRAFVEFAALGHRAMECQVEGDDPTRRCRPLRDDTRLRRLLWKADTPGTLLARPGRGGSWRPDVTCKAVGAQGVENFCFEMTLLPRCRGLRGNRPGRVDGFVEASQGVGG
jgi:hypothetical protein